MARILNEILKFSVLQVLYLYNYSIKVMKKITIAIDGFSSCGKSTMAKDLAREIGYIYIDSGAMYRAVTLYSIENGIFQGDRIDAEKLKSLIKDIHISFRLNPETGRPDTYLNGVNVENKIRTMEVSSRVSPIATLDFVREAMVAQQQEMGKAKGIVMDGRDIGTTVFPDAELKIFVTATPEIRAQRRYDKLIGMQSQGDVKVTVRDGTEIEMDVGDTVAARDQITGITVQATVTKKITKTKNGSTSIDYEAS